MIIENNTIVYFTGTGNSLKLAKDIVSEMEDFKLCKVSQFINEKEVEVKSKFLGIVFPVYYARMPLIMEQFVRKLNISRDTYVFVAANYAGAPAQALIKSDNILQDRKSKLSSGFLFRMPGNNIFAFNTKPKEKQSKIFEREEKKVKKVCELIRKREELKPETSKLVFDIVIDKMFIKTTDKIVGNLHMRDEKFWVNEKCNGCKLCENICPVSNIEFNLNKPTWKHKCQQCAACIQWCPKQAIQWGDKTLKRSRYRNPSVKISELINAQEAALW